jgi:hypothetical protein
MSGKKKVLIPTAEDKEETLRDSNIHYFPKQ